MAGTPGPGLFAAAAAGGFNTGGYAGQAGTPGPWPFAAAAPPAPATAAAAATTTAAGGFNTGGYGGQGYGGPPSTFALLSGLGVFLRCRISGKAVSVRLEV